MPRPTGTIYTDDEATWRWGILAEAERRGPYTARQMAKLLGLSSAASYRSYKNKNRLPASAWQRFEKLKDSWRDVEDKLDILDQVIDIVKSGYVGYIRLNGLAQTIQVHGSEYQCVVCNEPFVTSAGSNQYGPPKYCDTCRQSGDARRWREEQAEDG